MKEDDAWLDGLRARLDDYEEPLPTGGWERLQQAVDPLPEQGSRQRNVMHWNVWRTPLAVAAMLVVVFGVGFLFLTQSGGEKGVENAQSSVLLAQQSEKVRTDSQNMQEIESLTALPAESLQENLVAQNNVQPASATSETALSQKKVSVANKAIAQTENKSTLAAETARQDQERVELAMASQVQEVTSDEIDVSANLEAQNQRRAQAATTRSMAIPISSFMAVEGHESAASFAVDGYADVTEYLQKNFHPATVARRQYHVRLSIEADGRVSSVRLLNVQTPAEQDEALIQTLRNMPLWHPAQQGNKAVKSDFEFYFNAPER